MPLELRYQLYVMYRMVLIPGGIYANSLSFAAGDSVANEFSYLFS